MLRRWFLAAALAITVVVACTPTVALPTATTAAPTAAPTTAAPTVVRPSPTPSPTATPSPSAPATGAPGSPAPACPTLRGGDPSVQAQLTAVRVAHDPGFDRVVFEFGPSPAPGTFGLPKWSLTTTSSFIGTSGRPVPVDGNAFFQVVFQGASTGDPITGRQTFTNTDIHPALPLVRNVKLVDDFERVMIWGIGVERLVCPKITELAGPPRLVVDLPTPP